MTFDELMQVIRRDPPASDQAARRTRQYRRTARALVRAIDDVVDVSVHIDPADLADPPPLHPTLSRVAATFDLDRS